MRKPLLAAAASISLLLGSEATAETNAYLELNGGASFAADSHLDVRSGGSGKIEYESFNELRDLGLNGGGGIGVHFNADGKHSWRTELAGTYRRSYIDEIKLSGSQVGRSGDMTVISGMFNLLYEHDFGNLAWVKLFIGGGAGAGLVAIQSDRSSNLVRVDDQSLEFAWNAMTGVVLPVADHFDLTAMYRYFGTLDATLDADTVNPATGQIISTGEIDAGIHVHEAVFGLRVSF